MKSFKLQKKIVVLLLALILGGVFSGVTIYRANAYVTVNNCSDAIEVATYSKNLKRSKAVDLLKKHNCKIVNSAKSNPACNRGYSANLADGGISKEGKQIAILCFSRTEPSYQDCKIVSFENHSNLSNRQALNAAVIIMQGRRKGISHRGITTALSVAIVESKLKPGWTEAKSDNTSAGIFQQIAQPKINLYNVSERVRMNPYYASDAFFNQYKKYPDLHTENPALVAADVQHPHSSKRWKYGQVMAQAMRVQAQVLITDSLCDQYNDVWPLSPEGIALKGGLKYRNYKIPDQYRYSPKKLV